MHALCVQDNEAQSNLHMHHVSTLHSSTTPDFVLFCIKAEASFLSPLLSSRRLFPVWHFMASVEGLLDERWIA
jgi:hypothetical protein